MPKEIRNPKSEFLHCGVGTPPNRRARRNLPLPSTGRGIEGEGWECILETDDGIDSRPRSAPPSRWHDPLPKSPLTPAFAPLRGEGEAGRAPRNFSCRFHNGIAETKLFQIS